MEILKHENEKNANEPTVCGTEEIWPKLERFTQNEQALLECG